MISEQQNCPNCGQPLRGRTVRGVCASCVWDLSLFGEPSSRDQVKPSEVDNQFEIPGYTLLEELGRGGMAVVYRARQTESLKEVALKMLMPFPIVSESVQARFRQEAQILARLDHPHILPVYHAGEEKEVTFFTMKLAVGTLAARIEEYRGRYHKIADLVETIARAIGAAHELGVLHRDVKPGNVLFDESGHAYVADFGLARLLDAESDLTHSQSMLGTPSYMAPEQVNGNSPLPSVAVDVYGLGAVLYHLLTGQPPFRGSTPSEVVYHVVHSEMRSPRKIDPALDPDLEAICLKCLEREPGQRYESAQALANDLKCWLSHKPTQARPLTGLQRAVKWTRRNSLLFFSLVVIFLVSILGMVGIIWQWRATAEAKRALQEELWRAQLLETKFFRIERPMGYRGEALQILDRASAHRPSVALRNEAIAVMAMPDIGSNVWWKPVGETEALMEFSGDLQYIASYDPHGQTIIRHHGEIPPVTRLQGPASVPIGFRFSPDDSLLAVQHRNGALQVWDWRRGQLKMETEACPSRWRNRSFDFRPGSNEFWLSDPDERLMRFSLVTGERLAGPNMEGNVAFLQFDPTGKFLAGWGSQLLIIWDAATGEKLEAWIAPSDIWCLAWQPQTLGVAIGTQSHGAFWGALGQPELVPFESISRNPNPMTDLAFTPDGAYVFGGGWNNLCVVWNAVTQQKILHNQEFWFLQVNREGTQVAGFVEHMGFGLRHLKLPSGIRHYPLPPQLGGGSDSASWHPNGKWLLTGHKSGWALWDTEAAVPVATRSEELSQQVAFLPKGFSFVTADQTGVKLWSCEMIDGKPSPHLVRPLTPLGVGITDRVAISPDGNRFATAGKPSWMGTTTATTPAKKLEHDQDSNFLKFSRDGRWICLSTFRGNNLRIYNAHSGESVTNLNAGTYGFSFSPSGDHLLSLVRDHLTMWQVGSWKREKVVPFGRPDELKSVHLGFWPGTSCIVTRGKDASFEVWDVGSNREVMSFWNSNDRSMLHLAPDAAGLRWVVQGRRPWIEVWDLKRLRPELRKLGLDWPDNDPSRGFAPRAF